MKGQKQKLFLLVLLVLIAPGLFFSFSIRDIFAEDVSEIEENISDVQKKIQSEEQKKKQLEQQLGQIQSSVNQTQYEINKTQSLINETEENITRKEKEIELFNRKIELNKILLAGLLRDIYYNQGNPVEVSVLKDNNFMQFLGYEDHIASVERKIVEVIDDIKISKSRIENEKNKLEETRGDHEKLLNIKQDQQQELVSVKSEVQADIQSKEATISQLQGKLVALRNRYSSILGKSISTDDILEAAKYASKATGMSKSFLLGVLVQESNKGQNVGNCDYKESKMSSYRLEIFKDICDELDYNYKKQKVSCPPKSYKGTGGAMGVAQFMPDTWKGYKSSIASLTGHNPPDPWSLVDGVTAMAIKLSRDGASKKTRFDEAKSYCIYLAGGNWGYYCFGKASSYRDSYEDYNCWGSSIRNYGERVLCLKDNYEKYYQ